MNKSQWDKMSLTEKIRWRNKHPIRNSWLFADKILAKDIALKRAPECKVNKILFIPSKLDEIDISKLPKNYIFKANHGSGWLIKVKDGKNEHTGEIITNDILVTRAKRWLSQMYGHGNERQYSLIEPRVFFEEYLDDFTEFRFFCFEGIPKFFMIDVHSIQGVRTTIYDSNWKRINARWLDPEGEDIKKPKNFSKIIHLVEKLSKDVDFIRIDVLIKGEDIYFGEFTFTPNAGGSSIKPKEFDMLWGSYWSNDMSKDKELNVSFGAKTMKLSSKIFTDTNLTANILAYNVKRVLRKLR